MINVDAIIVWYNPDESNEKNILSFYNDVRKIFIIDNSKTDNSYLITPSIKEKIIYIPNYDNLGIAAAQNKGCELSLSSGSNWALLMDQDSYFVDSVTKYKELAENEYEANKRIAIFSPNIFPYTYVNGNISKVIASGSLINLSVWNNCGKFLEKLFIDEVDTEYCYKIRKNGYCIRVINEIKMQHTIGTPFKITLFGKNCTIQNHNYIRTYYVTRNRIYMIHTYFSIHLFLEYTKYNLR